MQDFLNFEELYGEAKSCHEQNTINSPALQCINSQKEKFTIKEVIGKGGMKAVFRAYDNFTRRDLALATLNSERETDYLDDFIYEGWLTSQLDHPNIIKVHELGLLEENRPFFTMDLKTGKSMSEIIKKEDLPLSTLLGYFIKICDAISFAHSRNILHLDIKPGNIQIGIFGEVVVCDWGLGEYVPDNSNESAKETDQQLLHSELLIFSERKRAEVSGTPGFMAPEQTKHSEKLSVKTDIYGLGSLLFYLLTKRVLSENNLNTHKIPKTLKLIIAKATSSEQNARYNSVKELQNDLLNFLSDRPVSLEQKKYLKRTALFLCRNHKFSIFIILILSTFLAVTFHFLLLLEKSHAEEESARRVASENLRKAENSIELYEKEKNAADKLIIKYEELLFLPKTFWDVQKFFFEPVNNVSQTMSRVNTILSRKPNHAACLREKVKLLLISQQFEKAAQFCRQHKIKEYEFAIEIQKKLKLKDSKILPFKKLLQLSDYFIKTGWSETKASLFSKIISYDYALRKKHTDYDQIVKKLLIYNNPEWKKPIFEYNRATKTLTLSGKGLKKLSLNIGHDDRSFLRFIPATTYILSGSEVAKGHHLGATPLLRHLDISNTPMSDLIPIYPMRDLITLTVHRGQFDSHQIERLTKKVKVIIK